MGRLDGVSLMFEPNVVKTLYQVNPKIRTRMVGHHSAATKSVIARTLDLIGVEAPDTM